MKLKLLSSLLLALMVITATAANASVVGKIKGTITDEETGEPLVGATVAVQGTALGAKANENGEYTVLNVPVGTYTLTVSAVGYAPVEVANVEVSADLAAYINVQLTSTVTDLGTTIKVRAERPLVTPDKTTSISIVDREQLQAMPVQSFEEVIGIQNSVVRANAGAFQQRQRGQRARQADGIELNLRGGRPQEVAYFVDGFSQQDPLTGLSTTRINNNAIKEFSVTSGAFSAEYGHVASGVVQLFTNSGGEAYHGNLELLTDNVLEDNFDQNYYNADFSGPIPGLDNGYFFFAGERRFLRDRSPSAATEEMITTYGEPFGLDTLYSENPQRLPSNQLSGWAFQGKLDYDFTPNFRFSLSGNGSIDNWREYRQEWILNPDHGPRYKDENMGINGKITHTLDANTFYNLSASYFITTRLRGDNEVFDDYAGYRRGFVNPEFERDNLFWTPAEEIIISEDSSIVAPSIYGAYLNQRSSYIGMKGDMTKQIGEWLTAKGGFEFQRHELRYFRNLDATKERLPNLVNRYGFDETAEVADPENFENETKNPINLSVYTQNRFEWRGLILNAGLRFDFYDYKTLGFKDPKQPFGEDQVLQESDLQDVDKYYRLSPRLGIAFPVSHKTQMRINYGKFYQRPLLQDLYLGLDFYEARVTAGSYFPFASPLLEPEKTTQYEVGISHQLGDNVAFDVSAYYKDVQDLTQITHQSNVDPRAYDIFDNTDYGTVKGMDFALVMRRTRNLRLDLRYTLSYATGTGSYAQSTYIINWSNPTGTPKTTSPLDYDQRHNFNALVDWRTGENQGPRLGEYYPLENTSVNFIVSAGSGTPYTPMYIYDEATEAAVRPAPRDKINTANKPWYFNIDVKLERSFQVGGFELTPYVWVKNLLDRENVVGVWEGTGEPDETGFLTTPVGQTNIASSDGYKEKYELKQYNPTNWSNPRMVFFGLRSSF